MTDIDLSNFVDQDVCVEQRKGSRLIAPCKFSGGTRFPYEIAGLLYTQQGEHERGRTHPHEIVEIRLASDVTVLKWITDRRPIAGDAVEGLVLHLYCPRYQPPQPEPEPPSEMQQLREQLAAIQARLDEMEKTL